MRWAFLMALIMVLPCAAIGSESAQAASDYKTRIVNSFETGVDENTDYGNWTSASWAIGGAVVSITRSSAQQYHGLYSAHIQMSAVGTSYYGLRASLNFTSNSSLGYFMFDKISAFYKLTGDFQVMTFSFLQYNGSQLVDIISSAYDARTTPWKEISVTPTWEYNTTHWMLCFEFIYPLGTYYSPVYGDFYLDYFFFTSASVDVRLRYWNLYTGFGYYGEKLLARYFTFPDGWIDIWRNEFIAYKGDELFLSITDIFNRNVWTGIVEVDCSPKYVDILAPIVTVSIPKPNWYNDSVPMEWQITCLPWGPDGLPGMEVPVLGFEFEVLAGWYNIAWFTNHYVNGGNQTVYISGNATERRSYMLSNFTIPINPDYEVEVNGDGTIIDLKSWGGFFNSIWVLAAALYDDSRVKALSLFFLFLAAVGLMYRARQLKKIAQGQGGGT